MDKAERKQIIDRTHEIYKNKETTIIQKLKVVSEFLDSCTDEEFKEICDKVKLRNPKRER